MTRRRRLRELLPLLPIILPLPGAQTALAQAASQAAPVAILTEMSGDVGFERDGRALELVPVASMRAGTRVSLAPGARIVLAYTEGGSVVELTGEGRFIVQGGAVQRLGGGLMRSIDLPAAFRALRIRADVETLQGGAAMRGIDDDRLQARGPSGVRPSADALAVCWNPLGPQWRYRVSLIDPNGRLVFDANTAGARQALPPVAQLEPGATYAWRLAASAPHGRSADAAGRFTRVAAPVEHALLAARDLAGSAGASPTERLLFEIAWRQQGLDHAPRGGCTEPQ